MLAKDIREMSEADINSRIAELERERFNLVLASGTRTLDDPLRLRVIRRDVARLKTVLQEKVIGVAEVGTGSRERRRVEDRLETGTDAGGSWSRNWAWRGTGRHSRDVDSVVWSQHDRSDCFCDDFDCAGRSGSGSHFHSRAPRGESGSYDSVALRMNEKTN